MSDSDAAIALQIGGLLCEAQELLEERGASPDHPRLKEIAAAIKALYQGMSEETKAKDRAEKFAERTPLHTIGGAL